MKKVLYFALLLCVTMVSCSKEDIENTATVNTAGDWYVTVNPVDEDGNVPEGLEDLFGLGRVHMLTYNTAANTPGEMIVDDLLNFWEFKVKVAADQTNLTFQTTTTEDNNMVADYEDINVTIEGGKILPQAGRQNNGSVADSIVFYVSFSDDPYPARFGYKNYKVSGVRYSGLVEND